MVKGKARFMAALLLILMIFQQQILHSPVAAHEGIPSREQATTQIQHQDHPPMKVLQRRQGLTVMARWQERRREGSEEAGQFYTGEDGEPAGETPQMLPVKRNAAGGGGGGKGGRSVGGGVASLKQSPDRSSASKRNLGGKFPAPFSLASGIAQYCLLAVLLATALLG